MKLEIKTKCAECGTDLDWYHEVSVSEFVCCVKPCPTCHPPKDEKVTPKEGEWVDVRCCYMAIAAFDRRIADGTRHKDGIGAKVSDRSGSMTYSEWRYPGEKEWRD